MNRFYAIILSTILVGISAFKTEAAEKTWTGAISSSFNVAENWQPSGVPTMSDELFFSGTISSVDCNLSNITVVSGLHVLSNYTGTIRSNADASGIFTVQGEILLEGGTLDMGLSKFKSMQLRVCTTFYNTGLTVSTMEFKSMQLRGIVSRLKHAGRI